MKLIQKLLALIAVVFAANAAQADTYDFSLTGDYSAHWQMSSTPTPGLAEDGQVWAIADIPGTFPTSYVNYVDLYFYNASQGGGMSIVDYYGGNVPLATGDSAQLYSGTEAAPVFNLGTFALDGTAYGAGTYTLTITNVSAVPEPGSYGLLLAGLSVIGFVSARRRKA